MARGQLSSAYVIQVINSKQMVVPRHLHGRRWDRPSPSEAEDQQPHWQQAEYHLKDCQCKQCRAMASIRPAADCPQVETRCVWLS